jgi:hypothetical protein
MESPLVEMCASSLDQHHFVPLQYLTLPDSGGRLASVATATLRCPCSTAVRPGLLSGRSPACGSPCGSLAPAIKHTELLQFLRIFRRYCRQTLLYLDPLKCILQRSLFRQNRRLHEMCHRDQHGSQTCSGAANRNKCSLFLSGHRRDLLIALGSTAPSCRSSSRFGIEGIEHRK